MPKISDTQAVLLSAAAQRGDGSLYPLPEQLKAGAPLDKALAALISRGFVDERETITATAVHRADGDVRYGIFATVAGLAAIGVALDHPESEESSGNSPAANEQPPRRPTKIAGVLTLLSREEGATLAELIAATDWLPHTTRAALTGLKKKGHVIERGKRGEATSYRIVRGQA